MLLMVKPQQILWLVPIMLVIDLILMGPRGVAPDNHVRYLLFFATLVVLGYFALRNRRIWGDSIRLPLLLVSVFLICNAVWVLLIPMFAGGSVMTAWSDAKSLVFMVVPIVFVLASSDSDKPHVYLISMIVTLATLLGWFQLAIWFVGNIFPDIRALIGDALNDLFQAKSIYVGTMGDGFFRVFWISSIWLLPAIFYLPLVARNNALRLVCLIGLVGGVYVSYSRGIWIGLIIGVFALLALVLKQRSLEIKPDAFVIWLMIVIAGFLAVDSLQGGSAAQRAAALGSENDISMNVRIQQVRQLLEAWVARPWFGWGYGASIADIRDPSVPYSYEMVPFALLMKLGVIGTLSWVIFFLSIFVTSYRLLNNTPNEVSALLPALSAFLPASMTNPMLFNFVGMGILSVLVIHWIGIVSYDGLLESGVNR
ncbi:MAG: O-antigen ligase family protein [Chromatiales bacterium]|nr:O-antigen ligase family protein [Chromatiales bacterium]